MAAKKAKKKTKRAKKTTTRKKTAKKSTKRTPSRARTGRINADYHTHCSLCGHAEGDVADYVKVATKAGLQEVGLSAHLPLLHLDHPNLAMGMRDLSGYIRDAKLLAEEARGITVRVGIEVDYIPGEEREVARILQTYPFDYVIGSVHFLHGRMIDSPDHLEVFAHEDADGLYHRYHQVRLRAVRSGLFDVLGHADLIKKHGHRPSQATNEMDAELASALSSAGMAVELNTSGLRRPINEAYPSPEILKACRKASVPVCVGSDAHRPADVGAGFAEAARLLRDAGYRSTVRFADRQREEIRL